MTLKNFDGDVLLDNIENYTFVFDPDCIGVHPTISFSNTIEGMEYMFKRPMYKNVMKKDKIRNGYTNQIMSEVLFENGDECEYYNYDSRELIEDVIKEHNLLNTEKRKSGTIFLILSLIDDFSDEYNSDLRNYLRNLSDMLPRHKSIIDDWIDEVQSGYDDLDAKIFAIHYTKLNLN